MMIVDKLNPKEVVGKLHRGPKITRWEFAQRVGATGINPDTGEVVIEPGAYYSAILHPEDSLRSPYPARIVNPNQVREITSLTAIAAGEVLRLREKIGIQPDPAISTEARLNAPPLRKLCHRELPNGHGSDPRRTPPPELRAALRAERPARKQAKRDPREFSV